MKLQLQLISLSLFLLLLCILLQEGDAKKGRGNSEAAKQAKEDKKAAKQLAKENKEAAKQLAKIEKCAKKCDADNAKESDVACGQNGYAYKNKCMLKCRGETTPAKSREHCRKDEKAAEKNGKPAVEIEDDDPDFNPEDYNFSTYDLESYMAGSNSTDEGKPAEEEKPADN